MAVPSALAALLPTAILMAAAAADDSGLPDDLRLNQVQLVGTHNSYHIAPAASQLNVLGRMKPEWRDALDYTHRPLTEQFGELGVRHIELDIYADPKGGMFAAPYGANVLTVADRKALPPHDPEGKLAKPGFKIVHVPDFDYRTTVLTLVDALNEVRAWSKANPTHLPIMVLLEMKDARHFPLSKRPVPIGRPQLEAAEAEILSVFDRAQLITPDDIRGDAATLRKAVLETGWPKLRDARGKILFALDNGGGVRDTYLKDNASLEGRLLFATAPREDHPAAAWFKLNNPIGDFDRIRRLVRAGFLIRTRADSETREARANDTRRRDKAITSGAQFISTDYPEAKAEVSDYEVRFEGGKAYRQNSVNAE